jgi:transposase
MSATVQDFARYYSCSILPARPQRPQVKAKVESAVQVVDRLIKMRFATNALRLSMKSMRP